MTDYLLLKLVIEQVRERPLADVLRDGVLAVDGLERLVHQPDERPTEPMAMPAGASSAVLASRGGYLPSLATATAYNASGAIASDSPSLARWWRAFCAGEVVSQASLTRDVDVRAGATPRQLRTWHVQPCQRVRRGLRAHRTAAQLHVVGSLPARDEAVIVVLTNHEVEDGHLTFSHGLARPLVAALRAR